MAARARAVTDGAGSRLRRAAAWGVHLLTASGAPVGILALLAAGRGDVRTAFLCMAYSLAVDAIDGTLARAVGVARVLPYVDGAKLDDIVDYFTYVIVPAVFLVQTDLLPPGAALPVVAAVTVASGYGFSRTDAKTPDHYFTGFPSYWNIVAFYLWALGWPRWVNAAIVLALAAAVFLPIRYVYPSRTRTLRPVTVGLGIAWAATLLWVLAHLDRPSYGLVVGSLLFPVYYVLLSLLLTVRRTA